MRGRIVVQDLSCDEDGCEDSETEEDERDAEDALPGEYDQHGHPYGDKGVEQIDRDRIFLFQNSAMIFKKFFHEFLAH